MRTIRIKKLREDARIPEYANPGDAGADLFSMIDATLMPGERILIPTGISIALPYGFEAQVRSKSGIALKNGVFVLNSPGTVDQGYRGEVGVILFNSSKEEYKIEKGQKVAQLVLAKCENAIFITGEELTESVRGEGGFGSTGIK